MRAIILAAGRGSRMQHLTEDRPKCLVELHGRPLLQWQRDALGEAGIEDVAVVTGYLREQLADKGLHEFNNPIWDRTNMVASLACAADWLEQGPASSAIPTSSTMPRPSAFAGKRGRYCRDV